VAVISLHAAALFRTFPARFRALLAVVGIVPGANLATPFAHVGAHAAQIRGEVRRTSHEAGGKAADLRAIDVRGDAISHHLNVVLPQAGGGAVVTSIGASVAGGDAGRVVG
jgi:hypothetical protein